MTRTMAQVRLASGPYALTGEQGRAVNGGGNEGEKSLRPLTGRPRLRLEKIPAEMQAKWNQSEPLRMRARANSNPMAMVLKNPQLSQPAERDSERWTAAKSAESTMTAQNAPKLSVSFWKG